MLNQIRYRLLMRQLRREIAAVVKEDQADKGTEKIKSRLVTACKACGSIV